MNPLFNKLIIATLLWSCALTAANAHWRHSTDAHDARCEAATVLHDDKMILLNGLSSKVDIVNTVEVFDPSDESWSVVSTTEVGLGNAVTHTGTILIDDDVWLIGGRIGDHPGKVSDKVWIYNITKNTWRPGPKLPAPFAGGGAGLVDNKIYVFGGMDKKGQCDVDHHFVYDLDKDNGWQDISDEAPMPLPRNHFSSAVYNGRIYALGGQNNHDRCNGNKSKEVAHSHVFSPESMQWTRLNDLPFNRSHATPSTFVYNDQILIVGGRTRGEKVLSYDPNSDTWDVLDWMELPTRITAPAARIIGNKLYVATGADGDRITDAGNKTRVLELPKYFLESSDDDHEDPIPTPTTKKSWSDSYSVDGQCYCDSTYDHGIGEVEYQTPIGVKKVKDICKDIRDVLGSGKKSRRVYYNTIQCGYDPVNTHYVNDEWTCPGIPRSARDYTGYRCFEKGARWNLDKVYGVEIDEPPVNRAPVITLQENYSAFAEQAITVSAEVSDDQLPNNQLDLLWKKVSGPGTAVFQDSSSSTTTVVLSKAGTYVVSLTADDGELSDSETTTITVSSSVGDSSQGKVVYRVNAGGPAIQAAGGTWLADKNGSQFVNTGKPWSSKKPVDTSGLSNEVPEALFRTERWDSSKAPSMQWTFPVTPGQYIVRLYFAETWNGAFKTGKRVFDVQVEGIELNSFDVFAEAGANTALMKAFSVESDDTINIVFNHVKQNPAIKGIEIIQPGSDEIQDDDLPDETLPDETLPDETSSVVYRINAGGPEITQENGNWNSDKNGSQYVNTGKTWKSNAAVNTDLIDENVPAELFKTERWDKKDSKPLKWSLPVKPGTYEVRLYFAENWSGAKSAGKRVFDVTVEDQTLQNLDVFSEVGAHKALMKSFVVNSDSTLDISFGHVVQNPTVKGIEVIRE